MHFPELDTYGTPTSKLPNCPRCEEDELGVIHAKYLLCYVCGYDQHDDGSYGHNDLIMDDPGHGNVYCHLCDWQVSCSTMEQIEYRLGQHLWEAHGKRLLYRSCLSDGVIKEVPQ